MRRRAAIATALFALSASIAAAGPIPGKIAFIGLDHQVYLADPNGGEPRALTRGEADRMASSSPDVESVRFVEGEPAAERRFSWPTWSPDGQTIVVQGVTVAGGGAVEQAGIYRLDLARTGTITPIYENREHGPIYLYYAPTGREIAALISEPGALGLAILRVSDGNLRALGLGFPYYFSWRSDGDAIVTHTGGAPEADHAAEIALIDVREARGGKNPEVTKLSEAPVNFRAPAWSPDGGYVAYAVRREDGKGASLLVRARNGEQRVLASVSSRLVFTWAPDGKTLAVAEATTPDNLFFGGINLIRLADGHRESLYAGPLGAFFWSPDGTQILIAAPEFDSGEWRWQVVSRATREVREISRFFPTPEFQFLSPHFDQYAQSHRFWAPDSRHFVYFGYPTTAKDERKPVPATIWIADTKMGKVKRVADGRAGFWSPR
jgi:dipeptidyl aminopeptidase/acylaminoacyl peptidase